MERSDSEGSPAAAATGNANIRSGLGVVIMGTFDDSKYVIARKAYDCACCDAPIAAGARHLAYRPGQRTVERICHACSLMRRKLDGGLAFPCRDVLIEPLEQTDA